MLKVSLKNIARAEFIVPIGVQILKGRFGKNQEIIAAFSNSVKRFELLLNENDKNSLFKMYGKNKAFNDFKFDI